MRENRARPYEVIDAEIRLPLPILYLPFHIPPPLMTFSMASNSLYKAVDGGDGGWWYISKE